ncbi:MAG: DNA polymerase III subunit delta [Victivallales bacterium]|nr:DNA polymerase III subunit delta [Victivallales bacterium]
MPALYLISGDDEFAIKARSRELITALCGEEFDNNSDLEVISGDSDELKPEDILTAFLSSLRTPPFLSPDKKIWLRHFAHFSDALSATAKTVVKERIAEITDFIKAGIPEDIVLVIDGPDIDQRKAFFKTCKAADSEIHIFRKSSVGDRDYAENQRRLAMDICRNAGKDIDPRAAYYLAETIAGDSGRLQSELEKVFCYLDDADRVTLEDCKNICSCTPEAMGWDFANALVDRDMPGAFRLVNTLVKQLAAERSGGIELSILSQAAKTFQEMVKTKNAMAELETPARVGKSYFSVLPPDIKDRYPDNILLKMHPYRAYKVCESASRFSDRELAQALRVILEANRKLVSGGGQPRIVLEQLIVAIIK